MTSTPLHTIQQGFLSYLDDVIPGGASTVQISESKRAFFAGAFLVITELLRIGGDDVSEDAAVEILEALSQECFAFKNAVGTEAELTPDELNPNHGVTRELRQQWHKLLAVVMFKLGARDLVIHSNDISEFAAAFGPGAAVCANPKGHELRLLLVDGEQAANLARREGGLPT